MQRAMVCTKRRYNIEGASKRPSALEHVGLAAQFARLARSTKRHAERMAHAQGDAVAVEASVQQGRHGDLTPTPGSHASAPRTGRPRKE